MPMTATVTGLSSSPWPGSNACQQMSGLAATFATQPRSGPSFPWVAMGLWTTALPGTEPVTSPFVGYVTQSAGARRLRPGPTSRSLRPPDY